MNTQQARVWKGPIAILCFGAALSLTPNAVAEEVTVPPGLLIQVTDNAVNDLLPDVENGKIVWTGWTDSIYSPDGVSIQQLPNSVIDSVFQAENTGPYIWDGRVIWKTWTGADDIFYWDGSQTVNLSGPNGLYEYGMKIHAGYIAWIQDPGLDNEIRLYDMNADSTETITAPGKVVQGLDMKNGRIVWTQPVSGNFEIFRYVIGNEVDQITNNTLSDRNPKAHLDTIAWMQSDGGIKDIRYFDGVDYFSLTSDNNPDQNPVVHSGVVVWERWDGVDWEIMAYIHPDSPFYP